MRPTGAIIIPTYNEAHAISALIQSIRTYVPEATIYVVDDASPDDTAGIVKAIARTTRNVRLIERRGKRGRGIAVIQGFITALTDLPDGRFFIEMDADGSHDPQSIPALIRAAHRKTVSVGSRYVHGSSIIDWPMSRRIASTFSNVLIHAILGLPLRDATNGFRCYPSEAVRILTRHTFITSGFIALSESAYLLTQRGFTWKEIPTTFVNRTQGRSNATLREFIESFTAVFAIKRSVR